MLWTVVIGIFLVLFVIFLLIGLVARKNKDKRDAPAAFAASGIMLLLAVIVAVPTMTQVVDARSYGVKTSAGKFVETTDSGLLLKMPWTKVEEFTSKVQDVETGTMRVTFSDGGHADFNATIRYVVSDEKEKKTGEIVSRIKEDSKNNVEKVWRAYLTEEDAKSKFVKPSAKSVAKQVNGDFSAVEAQTGDSQADIEKGIKDELTKKLIKGGFEVVTVEITQLDLDDVTQSNIDKLAAAKSAEVRKLQEQTNAKIDASTDKLRNKNLTPLERCLSIIQNWNVKTQGPAPTTLNCGLTAGGTVVAVR